MHPQASFQKKVTIPLPNNIQFNLEDDEKKIILKKTLIILLVKKT